MMNFHLQTTSLSNTFLPIPKCVNFAKFIKDLLVMFFKGLSHILKISDQHVFGFLGIYFYTNLLNSLVYSVYFINQMHNINYLKMLLMYL